jgi:hypothetical protein
MIVRSARLSWPECLQIAEVAGKGTRKGFADFDPGLCDTCMEEVFARTR